MKTINTLFVLFTLVNVSIAQISQATIASTQTTTASTENLDRTDYKKESANKTKTLEAKKDFSSEHTQLAVTQLKSELVNNIEYSDEMIALGVEGTVVVELIVSEDGFIKESNIARGLHPMFDQAVLNAANSISSVQFEQANYMGVPKVYVPILFTLTD